MAVTHSISHSHALEQAIKSAFEIHGATEMSDPLPSSTKRYGTAMFKSGTSIPGWCNEITQGCVDLLIALQVDLAVHTQYMVEVTEQNSHLGDMLVVNFYLGFVSLN